MAVPGSTDHIRRLRDLADKARTHAQVMSDRASRQTLLRLAEDYEDLARRTQSWADERLS